MTIPEKIMGVLSANYGQLVSADLILDAVYPNGPPRTGAAVIRRQIHILRERIPEDQLIICRWHSYRLAEANAEEPRRPPLRHISGRFMPGLQPRAGRA